MIAQRNPKKIYLSIDLDYWRYHTTPESCTSFFQQVWQLKLPVHVAAYHHHLLPHVNSFDCNTLINVDYHSDLCDLPAGRTIDFTEGTWINFVDWRFWGTFTWRFPTTRCLNGRGGYCHVDRNPFEDASAARWDKVQKRVGLWGIPWHRVKAVGVSVSPNWIGSAQVLMEPLSRLRITRWLKDYARQDESMRRRPKTVRV